MEKTLLTLVFAAALTVAVGPAQAQIYRYNPQTGKSDDISSPPKPVVAEPSNPTAPVRPTAAKTIKPASTAAITQIKQVMEKEKAVEKVVEGGTSTGDLVSAVNEAIAEEEAKEHRKMLPLGRVGFIINPKEYNPTIERNIAEVDAIADLDKVYMTPPILMTTAGYLMEWKKLSGREFIADSGNQVQKKFGLTKVPGFIYIRPDGSHNAYGLDDLAPFYEALTVQRRKVVK